MENNKKRQRQEIYMQATRRTGFEFEPKHKQMQKQQQKYSNWFVTTADGAFR